MPVIVQLVDGAPVNHFFINKDYITIGRTADKDIYIEDPAVSSDHAAIEVSADKETDFRTCIIKDHNSTNHTYVNGKQIEEYKLQNNDTIRIGWSSFKFIDENAPGFDETLKMHKSWLPGIFYTK